MSHYVNSYYITDMDKFYTVYLSVIIVEKPTCVIPRDLRHTPSMAAYKMIRLKFELHASPQYRHPLAMNSESM